MKTTLPIAALAAAVLFGLAGKVLAQAAGDSRQPEPGYELRERGDGFIRMNRNTGAISYCRVVTENLVCRSAADEREAYEQAIDRLTARVEAAEARLAALEKGGDTERQRPPERSPGPDTESQERESAELDRAVEFAERAMRRFFDAIKDIQRDMERDGR